MKQTFLDFEQPIAELQQKIDELRFVHEDSAVDISDEIARLTKKSQQLTKEIYASSRVADRAGRAPSAAALHRSTTSAACSRLPRAARRSRTTPTIRDRRRLARFNGKPCMVLGHQKGRDTKEKIHRNFGMPRPEGYRKALRLMKLAEKFGCRCSRSSTRRARIRASAPRSAGQSEAIGRNLYEMAGLRIPIIVTVIGEGRLRRRARDRVGDVTLMLQYATYSVISPEGCASILWKSAEHAPRPPRRSASPRSR
jgi:acetyl-CoA carboxylase carboxyl transferase subunit alpha